MIAKRASAMIFAVAILTACDGTSVVPEPEEFDWQGVVEGMDDWTHLTAEAAMRWTEGDGAFTAGILLAGDRPGAVRPWHVHHNTCAEGGGIVGEDGHYPRLVVGADGSASSVAEVPIIPDPAARYHVNIHRSAEEMDVIIACGDITVERVAARLPPAIPGY